MQHFTLVSSLLPQPTWQTTSTASSLHLCPQTSEAVSFSLRPCTSNKSGEEEEEEASLLLSSTRAGSLGTMGQSAGEHVQSERSQICPAGQSVSSEQPGTKMAKAESYLLELVRSQVWPGMVNCEPFINGCGVSFLANG